MRKLPNFGARPALQPAKASGFTLVELMVVILVITILTIIAVPSYTSQVRKSRRTEAKSILLDLAAREERYIATNGAYTDQAALLGFSGWGNVGSGYYSIAAPTIGAPVAGTATTAAQPATFSFTAAATANGNQNKDTQCESMTINQMGTQSSSDAATGGNPTTGCW